jgi:hypothetical protein
MVGIIRTLICLFSTMDCLLLLHCTLVRSILKYASPARNNITTIDVIKLESIQRKFASLCYKSPPPPLHHSHLLQLCLCTWSF